MKKTARRSGFPDVTKSRTSRRSARSLKPAAKTSWNEVGKWYNEAVGQKGHYYHEHVIFPKLLPLLHLQPGYKLLDLGCGQGVLARQLPEGGEYWGIDAANSLISAAQKQGGRHQHFLLGDATKALSLKQKDFTHATCILALQNMEHGENAVKNAAHHLRVGGTFTIVLNHPAFRIPRQTSWETDPKNQMQYRRVNAYRQPQRIPITAHPGKTQSPVTWSFHHPLQDYTTWLRQAGFAVTHLEEWISDKESEGKAAKAENRSRLEIPLFLCIHAVKLS